MNCLEPAKTYLSEFAEIRHDIHAHPEIGNQEFRTSEIVEKQLQSFGIHTERLTETAVMGTLSCNPGKTIAFRADMDALPIQETTSCPFASTKSGFMHACGHDVHTAALLETAKILSLHKEELSGTVKFFFQPDEEGNGGAQRMIDKGCMKDVSAVYGAHVDPTLPLGTIGIRYGKFYAASLMYDVTVKGKSAHGAYPEQGIDALAAAAEMATAVRKLPKLFLPGECVITTGRFNSGTARNIVADSASFQGIIRVFGNKVKEELLQQFKTQIDGINKAFKTETEIHFYSTHNGVVNTDRETDIVKEAVLQNGLDLRIIDNPLLTTEDFGHFIDAVHAGSFYHIGVNQPYPLHNSSFLPDDEAVAYACAAHLSVAYKELKHE